MTPNEELDQRGLEAAAEWLVDVSLTLNVLSGSLGPYSEEMDLARGVYNKTRARAAALREYAETQHAERAREPLARGFVMCDRNGTSYPGFFEREPLLPSDEYTLKPVVIYAANPDS